MKSLIRNTRAVGKVTLTFTSLIVGLFVTVILVSSLLSSQISSLQTTNNQLQSQYDALQSQYNQLNTQYQQLQSSQSISQTPQSTDLQSQITSLQAELRNATDTIAELQGQTGILPTFVDLGFFGPYQTGYYVLQLSLKNTGNAPITQIFVTLNSVPINMTLTYMNTTIGTETPLPPYQIATGREKASPPIDTIDKSYPLIIQATATNGTTFTYQTTVKSHG